jgi:SAM-dependent methyltransferase
MYLTKIYTRLEKYLKKMPIWFNILLVLAILFVIISIYKKNQPLKEGFIDQKEKFVEKTGLDLYDDFYVNIYDQLFYTELANQYEVGSIQNITKPTSESNILIIGSGTGKTANTFEKEGIKVTGLDESSAMVKYAKEAYPKINFIVGDPLKSMTVQSSQYTDIICLNMEIYKYKDKTTFIQNVYNWLRPGGYFTLHLVDKTRFDPVVPAGKPFVLVNPQSFAEKRITTSSVIFNNFKYKSDFQVFPNDVVQFKEIFKDTTPGTNKVRENIHKMWMPSKESIINQCKEVGFISHAQVDLRTAYKEYQYLYIFQKPE